MGTQQLILILLGAIVIAVAIAVGLSVFKSNSESADRDQVVSELQNLASKAQAYYRKPKYMSGGGGNFKGFSLSPADTGNTDGSYSCTQQLPRNTSYVAGSIGSISPTTSTIYIVGCGKELGHNGKDVSKAYAEVTSNSIAVTILN